MLIANIIQLLIERMNDMNIQNLSKDKREATVELSAGDLVMICNALYSQRDEKKDDEHFLRFYSDMMLARDLCQYGHVDNFSLHNIVQCRNNIGSGLEGVLSDDDIDTFNAYLEDNDMPTAFGNSDWRRIYRKIVGEPGKLRCGEKITQWMKRE